MKASVMALVVASACSAERAPPPAPRTVPHDAALRVEQSPADAALVDAPALPERPLAEPLPAEADSTGVLEATFGPLTVKTPTCWYFSGPQGRDNRLGATVTIARKGDQVWMHWGSELFIGTIRDDVLDVRAVTMHVDGKLWTVDEKLRGVYRDRQIRGHYTYEECQQDEVCPGSCTISASVLMQER